MKSQVFEKFSIAVGANVSARLRFLAALVLPTLIVMPTVSYGQSFFTDDTSAAGGPFYSGESWGAAWGDFNGDLYPDLFTSNHGTLNSVLRNNGDGTFSETVDFADSERIWTGAPLSDIHGGTFGDYDNDGDQDMFVTRSSTGARVHLMENSGLGGFTEIGGPLGVGPYGGGRMPMLVDYTGDGFLDLFLARVRNDGAQVFEWDSATSRYVRKSIETGFDSQCYDNSYGMASDVFNNGKLLYICANEQGVPEHVFDTSTIPFTDVSADFDSIGTNSDAVLADFNNDLKIDLFAVRGFLRPSGAERISSEKIEAWFSVGGNVNFEKSFTFQATGPITINAHARHVGEPGGFRIGSTGYVPNNLPLTLDPTDTLNHGVISPRNQRRIYVEFDDAAQEWTIHLSGGGGQSEGAYITVEGVGLTEPTVTGLNSVDMAIEPRMLLNNGSRLEDAGSRGIGSVSCSSIAAADYDNDMDVDLYLVCRTSTANLENRLYLNDGTGNFTLASTHGGEGPIGTGLDSLAGTGETAVAADYNVDGLMDVFVTNGGRLFPHVVKDGFSGGGPNTFFRNIVSNSNHWLQFDLEGVTSNRDGFGAKVIVTAGGVTQMREQNGMYHRWSHDSRRLHFGLGANTTADVTIEWPNGSVDTYTAVAADKLYSAVEDDDLTEITPALNGPSLAVAGDAVVEGDTANVLVSMFPPSANTVTVDYQTFDLDAISTLDYSPVTGTLTFDPQETEKTIDVQSLLDLEDEDEVDERFELRLANPIDASLNQEIASVDIEDDDDGGANGIVMTVTGGTAEEGKPLSFNFSLSSPSTEKVTVRFATEQDTATADTDYTSRSGKVTMQPGVVSVSRQVVTLQDSELETDEDFVLVLTELTNANILETRITGTIIDDDTVIPDISIDSITLQEGGGADLTVSLSEQATDVVTVDFATVDGTAVVGSDYTAVTGNLTFAIGELSKTITVDSLQDLDVEGDETYDVQLSNAVNGVITQGTGVVTIEDNDTVQGGPIVSVVGGSEIEGARVPFTFSLSAPSTDIVRVDFNTIGGTATSNVDYEARVNGRVTFSPGQVVAVRRVTTLQDTLIEADETFDLQLSNPSNANIDQISSTGTITDDDSAGALPTLSVSDASSDEGDKATFTITLSEASTSVVKVDFNTLAGTAVSDVDYQARFNGRITFQPGVLSLTRKVTTLQDTDIEADETYSLELSNPVNATINDGSGAGTIIDDDSAPAGPDISVSDASATEGGKAAFTISLSAASTEVVTVDFDTVAGSATSDVDYQSRSNGRVTFQPGVVSAIRRVTTIQDTLVEGSEDFSLELSNASNGVILDGTGNAVITDDD